MQNAIESYSSHQKPGNHNLNEKRQSTHTNTEISLMLELFDRDIKAAIIKMLRAITSSLETNEKSTRSQEQKNKNNNNNKKVTPKFKWKLQN